MVGDLSGPFRTKLSCPRSTCSALLDPAHSRYEPLVTAPVLASFRLLCLMSRTVRDGSSCLVTAPLASIRLLYFASLRLLCLCRMQGGKGFPPFPVPTGTAVTAIASPSESPRTPIPPWGETRRPVYSAAWRDRVVKRAGDGSPWNTLQAAVSISRDDAFTLTRSQCVTAYAAYRASAGVPSKPAAGPGVAAEAYTRADAGRSRAWATTGPRLGGREVVGGHLVQVGMEIDTTEDAPDDPSMVAVRSTGNHFGALSSPRGGTRATSSRRPQSTRSVRPSAEVLKSRGQQKSRPPATAKVRPKHTAVPDISDMELEITEAAAQLKRLDAVDPATLSDALAHQVSAELASELGLVKSALQEKDNQQRVLGEQLRYRDASVLQTQRAAETTSLAQQQELQRAGGQQVAFQAQVADQLPGAQLHVQHVKASAKGLQLRAECEVQQAQQAQIRTAAEAEARTGRAFERGQRACAERDEARAASARVGARDSRAGAAVAEQHATVAQLRDESRAASAHSQGQRVREQEGARVQIEALQRPQQVLQARDQERTSLQLATQQQREEVEQLRRQLSARPGPPVVTARTAPPGEFCGTQGRTTGPHGGCKYTAAPPEKAHSSRLSGRLSHGSSDHKLGVASPISVASSHPVEVDLTTAEGAGCSDTLAKEILTAGEDYRPQHRALGEALSEALDAAGGRGPTVGPGTFRATRTELGAFLASRKLGQQASSASASRADRSPNVHGLALGVRDLVRRPFAAGFALRTGSQRAPNSLPLWEAEDGEYYDECDEVESDDDRGPAMIPPRLRDRDALALETRRAAGATFLAQQQELQRAGEQQAALQAQVADRLPGAQLHVQHVEASAKGLQLRAGCQVQQAQQAPASATAAAEAQAGCAIEREQRAGAERDAARAASARAGAAITAQHTIVARLREESRAATAHRQEQRAQEARLREEARVQVEALRQASAEGQRIRDQGRASLQLALQQQREESEQLRRQLSAQSEPPAAAHDRQGSFATRTARADEPHDAHKVTTGPHGDCKDAVAPPDTAQSSRLSGRLSHGSSDHKLGAVSPISVAKSHPVEVDLTTAEGAGCSGALAKEILTAGEGCRTHHRALDEAFSEAFGAAGGRHPTSNPSMILATRTELDAFLTNRRSG